MTTIYFFRHGETDYNRKGIVQGSGIDSQLNEAGQLQAQRFYQTYGHLTFDAVWGSELQRTHQTLKGWSDQGWTIPQERGLNELNWGVHEGRQPSPEQREDFLHTVRRWHEGDLSAKVKGGESPLEAWSRAVTFFEKIRREHLNQTLLMCSHGRQLRVILSMLIDEDLTKMEKYGHKNTALTVVELPPEGPANLHQLNDLSHLEV
ncbi:MAG: histidine phosphatase family protein [Bacteroidota bacterium]